MPTRNSMITKNLFPVKSMLGALTVTMAIFNSGCEDVTCFNVGGSVVDRDYWMDDLHSIEMHCEGSIFLSQGESQAIVLRSDEHLYKVLQFHMTNGKMRMDFTEDCVKDIGTFELYITTPLPIQDLTINSSGTITASDSLNAPDLSVNITGSGGVTLSEVYTNSMNLEIVGSGNILVASPNTVGSSVNEVSGSGTIHTFNTIVNDADVNISGSGNIEVHATDTLHGTISGSGNVRYRGFPGIDVSVTGSGDVIEAN